jgi:23S rRNA (cytidine1920-2'-O)/16S rRNA (cytidine1409-2'-O)-methyltransferase
MNKKRLDQILQERLPHLSRTQISSIIMQGNVTIDGKVVTKPGTQVKEDADIVCNFQEQKYVSRSGYKLEKAIEHFNINVKDLVVLDAGISTGGFTDCLLQNGAKKIYGVDVGYGQVHEKLRKDPRVEIIERTNLRELKELPEKVDLVTLDLSFISILKVMESVTNLMKDNAQLIVLIKPQFEAQKEQVGKGGIVRDEKVHKEVIENVIQGVKEFGFKCLGVIDSPITGTTGNKEFLAYFKK